MHLELTALVVDDYDEAIGFFVDVLGFDLIEDSPATTNDGRPKRWVVVRPPGAKTGLLLAQAEGDDQRAVAGNQFGGRVGLFLRVDDFDASYQRMVDAGVEFVGAPRHEPYGSVVVFRDVSGNRWDLLGPDPRTAAVRVASPVIRREAPDDAAAVRSVHTAAFARDSGEQPPEVALVDGLRSDGWLPQLSLVAELDGEVVGHVICSRGTVGDVACMGLGPIGVLPQHQRSGVGSALMWAAIGAADALDEPLIALLGNPDYYRRFGFQPSTDIGIDAPDPNWGPFFQVRTLSAWAPALHGQFRYAAPFDNL